MTHLMRGDKVILLHWFGDGNFANRIEYLYEVGEHVSRGRVLIYRFHKIHDNQGEHWEFLAPFKDLEIASYPGWEVLPDRTMELKGDWQLFKGGSWGSVGVRLQNIYHYPIRRRIDGP